METRMNTTKTELNNPVKLTDFSKAEVITMYEKLQLENEELKETIEQLKNFIRLGVRQKFSPSSEQFKQLEANQTSFFDSLECGVFNEAEAIQAETESQDIAEPRKDHARRIKGEVGASKRCFDHLPIVEVIEELPEGEQECPVCHSELKKMKTSERIEIEVIPVQIIKKKLITQSYVCNSCSEEGLRNPIIEAPKRLPVISGSYVSAFLMAYVMAKKYWERTTI